MHLVLPQIPGDGLSRIPDPGSASCDGPCLKLKGFLKATQALVLVMQDSVARMVNRITDLIPDVRGMSTLVHEDEGLFAD